MSAQRWVFPLRTEGPFEADLDDSRIKYVRAADYERDVAAAEVEMMRLISRSIADGHRGNGSAEDDVCCQVCQEIECDPDCAVAEAWAREAAAEVRGWNAAVRQLAGEGCTWADGDCPNGTDCLSCKNLDALITERAKGDVQGWNAALEAALEYGLGNQEQSAIAALLKPTEAQT